MKKLILLPAIFMAAMLFSNISRAQVHLDVNIVAQPIWGPVGYDHADFYYFPDNDMYYDVVRRQYIYFDHGRWEVSDGVLPARYHDFDLFHSYKVVLNEPKPWMHNDVYRARYAGFRGHHDQMVIRDSHEHKYWENKEHPEHAKWKGREEHKEERKDDHGRR